MLETDSASICALQRSRTAPTPLVDSPGASAAQWGGRPVGGRINRSLALAKASGIGTKPKAHVHAGAALVAARTPGRSVSTSPRHDVREDPFSLAGFFPSRPGSPVHAVQWAWRSTVEETMSETEEEEVERTTEWRSIPPTRSLSMNALDEYAREVIAKESRLGILGLARVPSFFKTIGASYFGEQIQAPSEPPFEVSAAAIDEPFDAETLLESMHSRRVASEQGFVLPERVPSFGLFTPASEAREAELGWASGLYTKLLGPEE